MDIMDSTDTPTGGLDRTTASSASSTSSSALPLSVDQRDDFASPTNRSSYGGQQPTSSDSFSFSSGGSAFDRVDVGNRMAANDSIDSMPTSTDDVMMPHLDYASHPSIMGGSSSSVSSDSSSPMADDAMDAATSTSASAKAKASDMADSAKAKASDLKDKAGDMADSAKAKAGDLKDKAGDMADSAKEKASDLSATAKTKAAEMTSGVRAQAVHMQEKAEDTADSIKEKLQEGAEKVKEGGNRLLEMAKSGLHQAESKLHSAEKTVEDKYDNAKEEYPSGREPHKPVAADIKGSMPQEATDTHPDASSMRDSHLHPGLSALPSHGNEIHPTKDPLMTDVHHNALMAGEAAHARAVANKGQAEAEDALQKGGFLHRMHDKLEDGAEAVKEKVDGFMERNVRSDNDEHLSAVKGKDLPTLIDSSHEHNTNQVRAKMHPSQERTMNGVNDE